MEFKRLEKNLMDIVAEQQLKLGYRSEKVRLYYPLSSLEGLLGTQCTAEEMKTYLKEFCHEEKERLGEIKISEEKERFCFLIPPEGSDYIHEHAEGTEFLSEFLSAVQRHGCTFDDILCVFKKYSGCVHAEETEQGEFDYLLYFEDGVPDDFLYCLEKEGEHMIYHRFTREDYRDFNF